jgi:hypothetical protein
MWKCGKCENVEIVRNMQIGSKYSYLQTTLVTLVNLVTYSNIST